MSKPIVFRGGGEEMVIPAEQPDPTVFVVTWGLEIAPLSQDFAEKMLADPASFIFRLSFATRQEAMNFISEIQRFMGDTLLGVRDVVARGLKHYVPSQNENIP